MAKYEYGEAWQVDSITLSRTHKGKRYVLAVVEATTGAVKRLQYPMLAPETPSGVWRNKCCGDVAVQGEWSQITGLISNIPLWIFVPKTMALSAFITSPVMHSFW